MLYAPGDGVTLPNETEVSLEWSASNSATGYYAHLWGGPEIDINSDWITDTQWFIGQLWPGDYHWQVQARDENNQQSDLSAVSSFSVAQACVDDAKEDNDLFDHAVNLSPGDYPGLQICSSDDDWFSFPLESGQQALIRLAFSHVLGDLDAELCSEAACDPPLADGYSTTDNELIVWRATAGGIYCLRIFGYNGAANSYDLHLSVDNLIYLPISFGR